MQVSRIRVVGRSQTGGCIGFAPIAKAAANAGRADWVGRRRHVDCRCHRGHKHESDFAKRWAEIPRIRIARHVQESSRFSGNILGLFGGQQAVSDRVPAHDGIDDGR